MNKIIDNGQKMEAAGFKKLVPYISYCLQFSVLHRFKIANTETLFSNAENWKATSNTVLQIYMNFKCAKLRTNNRLENCGWMFLLVGTVIT